MNTEPRFAISRRWIECVDLLIAAGHSASYKAFCASIGVKPQSLNDIKAARRAVTLDMVYDTCYTYQVSLEYLLMGTGSKLTASQPVTIAPDPQAPAAAGVQEPPPPDLKKTVSVEESGARQAATLTSTFPLITYAAAAGYAADYQRPDYYQKLASVDLPAPLVPSGGQGILLQIQGDDMAPSFRHGDWVAGTLLDREEWGLLRDGSCVVVVSMPLGIRLTRIYNELPTRGGLRCESDNGRSPAYELATDEILQLFRCVLRLSPSAAVEEGRLSDRVAWLEEATGTLRTSVEQLHARVGGLVGLPNP